MARPTMPATDGISKRRGKPDSGSKVERVDRNALGTETPGRLVFDVRRDAHLRARPLRSPRSTRGVRIVRQRSIRRLSTLRRHLPPLVILMLALPLILPSALVSRRLRSLPPPPTRWAWSPNPAAQPAFFEAAHARGERRGARTRRAKYGITIKIDWRTPNEEDAQKQADFVEATAPGRHGAASSSSCSDANKLTDAINKAGMRGCAGRDLLRRRPALASGWFRSASTTSRCGERTFEELAKLLKGNCVVAAIDGNPNAVNLQQRAAGFRAAAKKHPGIRPGGHFLLTRKPRWTPSRASSR